MHGKIHFSWAVCIGCMLLTTVTMGMVSNTGFSVYLPLITEHGGFLNVEVSLIITIRSIFTLVGMFILPWYYRVFEIRLGAALSVVMAALAFIVYGMADSIYVYYMGAAIAGVAYGLGSMIPVSIVINRWFVHKKALALGIAACGTGVATMFVPHFVTHFTAVFGIKTTMYIEAVLIFILAVVVFLLLRNDPASMRCEAYGAGREAPVVKSKQRGKRDMTKAEWIMLSLAMAMSGAVAILATSNISSLFASQGKTGSTAAGAISIMGIVLIAGKIVYGRVTDKIGAYRSNYIFSLILLLGLLLSCTIEATGSAGMYLSVILLGGGFPIALVGLSVWAGDFSTDKKYDQTVKWLQIFYQAGGLALSTLPGFLADKTGTYRTAYILFALLVIISIAIVQWMYKRFNCISEC